MKSRQFDPLHLDVDLFAKAGTSLEGRWPLAQLTRLTELIPKEAKPSEADAVEWQIRGEYRESRAAVLQAWLHLGAQAKIALECQRCLKAVEIPLSIERSFLFVHGEKTAEKLDAESEDDVLAMTRALDVRELVEDELLLALPLVPHHEICPQPLLAQEQVLPDENLVHPFAALAALKGQ